MKGLRSAVVAAIVGAAVGVSIGCAARQPCPEWFYNIPEDPNFLFAATTATSTDLEVALGKAKTAGRADIASQLEVRVTGLRKRFLEELGLDENSDVASAFTEVCKEVTSEVLVDCRPIKQSTSRGGMVWRACVLMRLPTGGASEGLRNRISKDVQWDMFRASQAYKELEEEVRKFEEWKKQQMQP